MFLKRSMVLAAGIAIFILGFIVYFDISDAQMEARFRAEREKYHSDNLVLTAPAPITTTAAHATSSTPDTNAIIGPVPPPSTDSSMPAPAPAPDNSAPATNAPADPNAAPLPPTPSSTRTDLPAGVSAYIVRAGYNPSQGSPVLLADDATNVPAAPAGAPSNAPAETPVAAPSVAPSNAAPATIVPATPATPTVVSPAPEAVPAMTNTAPAAIAPAPLSPHAEAVEGGVIVLLYHQFVPAGVHLPAKLQWTLNEDVFAGEMKYIHDNGYHVVSVQDVIRFLKHQITLPPGSVCITIDDGYKSAVAFAAPILKQYGFQWTFFIYPQFITNAEGPPTTGAASWNDLLELQKEGVDIECHSMTHPKLNSHHQQIKGVWHNLSPEEYDAWLTNETANSKAILEQKMGKTINCFAYPFGEYNQQVKDKAIAAGYEAIFTVAGNPVRSTTELRSIGRYTITQNEVKNFTAYLRQGALGLADATPPPGATITNPRPVISAVIGYASTLDPNSIETSVYGFDVKHDFDPNTNALRLYLPRDLIQASVPVSIRVKDAKSGQVMVASWHFNYEPVGGAAATHAPIPSAAPAPAKNKLSTPVVPAPTNTPPTAPEPMEKTAAGTPMATPPPVHSTTP